MTIQELVMELESIIAGNSHMANYEVRISAETSDYGTIQKIESPQNNKMVVFYNKKNETEFPFDRENYIYLQAEC